MKKTFLISTIGFVIILSACSQQLPDNNQTNKISELERQISQMQTNNQDLTKQISDLQNKSQSNLDLENQQLKKENEELKKELEQTKNTDNKNNNVDISNDSISYQEVINYINSNITNIINKSFSKESANGNWFADGYGFTSLNYVYVDFEDGHFLYRALLECDTAQNKISSCSTLAIFENQKKWVVIQGEDTQKDNPIIYKWAKDYEWER